MATHRQVVTRFAAAEDTSELSPLSASRVLAISGVSLIVAGMIFGDILAAGAGRVGICARLDASGCVAGCPSGLPDKEFSAPRGACRGLTGEFGGRNLRGRFVAAQLLASEKESGQAPPFRHCLIFSAQRLFSFLPLAPCQCVSERFEERFKCQLKGPCRGEGEVRQAARRAT
jgi:hypothetical protein